ncbi:membrane insertase OXA1 [Aspergillus homomorphus CBS 101889]|uniref:Membrane insertase YidC/Oxa/ALB C-terminal domain-containing protein n=1 Tax=Aspergillus homomorphus (strain CBS 101889) TaxID=1450537 RepID=A0A395HNR6_ASPHC|nr:hypothetical protein BO97DRAFT_472564 [Aspergillus homomorphus CBS 101889]RAL09129.1 hypothetical protein BO97DRAFT_472564 [Aspergillus homomorphus CBS 101889]
MLGGTGLSGRGAMPALARQRLIASSRSSRSMSSFRPQASRNALRYAQTSRPMAGTPSLRSASAIPAISTARFNSTAATPVADAATAAETATLPGVEALEIASIPEKIGYLKELGLDYGWGFSATIEWFIEHIHIWGGVPWWASIVCTGLLVRLAMLKPTLAAANTGTKLNNVKHITTPLRAKMMAAQAASDSLAMQKARAELEDLHKKHGIVAWKAMIPMLQIPFGFGCYRVIKGMTSLPVPALSVETAGWLQDITVADPYFILPAISSLCMYWSFKKGGESGANEMMNSEFGKMVRIGLPSISFVVMSFFPAALQLYFVSTGVFGAGQAWLLSKPGFRRWANVAVSETPQLAPGEVAKNPIRLLTEAIEAERATRLAAAPPAPPAPVQKISFIDRAIENFKESKQKLAAETTNKIDEFRGNVPKKNEDGTLADPPRLSEKDRKTAEDYEKRRREEEEWKREERNHARRQAHMKFLEQQREKARSTVTSSQGKLRQK